jgi:uncharacterized repeat protein (TIGR02543 family)
VTIVGPGTCSITASQAGDATYSAAPDVTRTFQVSAAKTDQSITFPQPADVTTASGPVTLTGTASSGLAVTYVSNSPSVCTVSGSTVTIVGPGTCSITASQAGDATYSAAPDVTRTFQVSSSGGAGGGGGGGGGGATEDPAPHSAPAVTYSVSYVGNGSTGGTVPSSAAFVTGATVTVSTRGALVRTGHAFAGWNTVASGSGTMRAEASTFIMGSENVTLYAQWTVISYQVTYVLGGASGIAPVQSNVLYGRTFTIASGAGLSRPGFLFVGWSDGTGQFVAGALYTMGAGNVTLTPQWTAVYSVTYSSNGSTGGSAPVDSSAYFEGAPVTVLGRGTLVRTGHTFSGWNTRADGSGIVRTESSTFPMGSTAVTLFAQWTLTRPAAPSSAFYTPVSLTQTNVRWTAPRATGVTYEVTVNGSRACVSSAATCQVPRILGPSSSVSVSAVNAQGARSGNTKAQYLAVRPAPALTVNFAVNSPVLTEAQKSEMRAVSSIIKREGFTELSIQGHTDAQGGTRNADALSRARAEATAAYFRELLPSVKFAALSGLGLRQPVASNATKQGQAKNRRSEILVR